MWSPFFNKFMKVSMPAETDGNRKIFVLENRPGGYISKMNLNNDIDKET